MEIQGREQFSPWAGRVVEAAGVVTQRRADGAGFWVQDLRGDGDSSTSDGILVAMAGAAVGVAWPAVGDRVRIVAQVEEEQVEKSLPLTQLVKVAEIEVISRGNPLPEPVPVVDLPDVELAEAIAFWEPLEGMRVSIGKAVVVAPTESWGEFAVLAEADAVAASGFYPQTHHMLIRSLGGDRVDYNPELIVLQSAPGRAPLVRPGDELVDVVGTVDYLDGTYKVWPDEFQARTRHLPSPPLSVRSGETGNVRIVTYNLRDLFDTIDTPGRADDHYTPDSDELDVRLDKLALSVLVELELPHVIVVNEYESAAILQAIGDRVNALAGTRYRSASLETSDVRGLEVGFLYDEDRVDLLDYYQVSGEDVEEAFGEAIFPTREPLVGTFRFSQSGPRLTIIANKFKTKRGEDPRLNVYEQPVRNTEVQRKLQAKVVRRVVSALFADDPDALVMVTGDLGDFQFPEPGEGEDHPIGIIEGLGDDLKLTNLIDLEEPAEAFTYIFQGNSVVVTHMLVSPALLDLLAGFDILHFNTGFPDRLREDRGTPIRASDRDPVEGRFTFPAVDR